MCANASESMAVLRRNHPSYEYPMKHSRDIRSSAWALGLLGVATCIWIPCMHLPFRRSIDRYRVEEGLSPIAQKLSATYLAVWEDPALRERELADMRRRNPEWDFMSRTYLVLALANMSMRESVGRERAVEIIDAIIADTLDREREEGHVHFLLAYGHSGSWVVDPPRSIFVDGEIMLMMAARRFLEEKAEYKADMARRLEFMVPRMRQSPVLCAESYPDECWLFCNTVALAAIRMSDVLDDTDHAAFLSSWVQTAKAKLVETQTGILISAFGVDGTPSPAAFGPEGSTIWMSAHMLEIVDPEFARDQYDRAREALGDNFLGFGYSREWPRGLEGSMDIDSGPVVPFLGASASASGLAVLGAAAFEDQDYLGSLMVSLECGGFPSEQEGRLRYLASNQVGDAVLLYAMTEGPLWTEVRRRMQ